MAARRCAWRSPRASRPGRSLRRCTRRCGATTGRRLRCLRAADLPRMGVENWRASCSRGRRGVKWAEMRAHYDALVARHGLSHKALDWGSRDSQELRFSVLAAIADLRGCSVLDVGCGLADFCAFL